MLKINDPKPNISMNKRGRNDATFGDSGITFNEAGITFNEVGYIFGGDDRISDIGPKLKLIKDPKP